MSIARAAGLVFLVGAASCRSGTTPDPPDVLASPQASAVPAPLANVPTAGASANIVDGAPPPVPMRPDQPIAAELLPLKEVTGYTIQATLHTEDAPAVPKGPEHSAQALDAARKKTEPRLTIDLGSGRARMVMQSEGFVLPVGTELRARTDRYGHVVLAADGSGYRVVSPGTLHALLGERRFDVAPLSAVEINSAGEGTRRLGYRTRKVSVVNRAAHATFEIARVADAGDAGPLLCRALLDLMNAPPHAALCAPDDVPMWAELGWTTRGTVTFTATSIVRRLDLPPLSLSTPPPASNFGTNAFAAVPSRTLLSRSELHALRLGDHFPDDRPSLTLVNPSDVLRYAWVDGVPLAWLAPGARLEVFGLAKGRASIEWRSFFGDLVDAPRAMTLPAVSTVGAPDTDAGAL
jgi:hypothetical protein